jgi:DNA mismatch endonuclease, patch repair protein
MDTFTPERRRKLMQSVRSSRTEPELVVRSALHRAGLRFARSHKRLPGRPDIVLPRHNAVVFVHGCFWHGHQGCRRGKLPKSNTAYWTDKIQKNRERDARVQDDLLARGWRVFCVWTCNGLEEDRLAELAVGIRTAEPMGAGAMR